jgi:hypothetical protein
VCLKLNFGVAPGLLGAPRRMRVGVVHMPSKVTSALLNVMTL